MCRLGEVYVEQGDPDEVAQVEGLWRGAASAGHPAAMLHLADLLREIEDEREDPGEEDLDPEDDYLAWYRRAAEQGNVEAMTALAWELYFYGDDEPDTHAEAENWWRTAAEAGDPIAMANLGTALHDDRERERWYRRAAAQGDTSAMYNLASLLASQHDPASVAEAQGWWRQAAAAGNPDAMRRLSRVLRQRGDGGSLREAEGWEHRAADEEERAAVSIAAASRVLGCDEHTARRILAAHDLLAGARVTATWEEVEALAVELDSPRDRTGDGPTYWVTPEQAAEILGASTATVERLLSAGRLPSLTHASGAQLVRRWQVEELATARLHPPAVDGRPDRGRPVEVDAARSAERRAADSGGPTVTYRRGLLQEQRDEGYPSELAEDWYRRAALAGHPAAMTRLAHVIRMYDSDSEEAFIWYRRAAELGDTEAMQQLRLWSPSTEDQQRWTRRLAESGDADAMVAMGFSALLHDEDEAMSWWRRAAATGNPDAMFVLGHALLDRGSPMQTAEARTWLRRAADAGQPDATTQLNNRFAPTVDIHTRDARSDLRHDEPPES
jgi:TPR repeat protein